MSAARNLKLEVVLKAIDKITGPLKAASASSVGLTRTLKETRDSLKALKNAQGDITTFRNMARDAAITGNQLKLAQDKVRLLSKEMAGTAAPSKAMTRQFQEAVREASTLKQRQQELSQKLQTARGRLELAGISTRNLASHQRDLKQQIATTTSSLQQQEQRLARVNAQQKRLTAAHASYGKTTAVRDQLAGNAAGALAAGTATGAALMVPVGEYAKAEDSATQLKVAMMGAGGQVRKEFGAVNALAVQLGNQLPGTTSEFQDMMRILIQKGMSAQVVLGGAGEATAKLAVLTKVSFTESASAISVLQDSMGVLDKDMVSAADQMQRLYNVGMNVGQIQEGFKAMGPALSYVRKGGIDAVKALAPLLAITDAAGMDAGSAGNAYNKIIRGSVDKKKVDKSNAELKGTGVKLNFVDAKGNFAGVDNMVNQIMKLNSLSDQKRKTVIETVFGSDKEVAEVMTALSKAGNTGIAAMRAKLESQASLQERVNAQLGTLQNLWDATSGTFTNAMVNFGEAIAPELKMLTEWLGNLSEGLGAWAKENPLLAGTLMKVAAVAAVLMVAAGGLGLAVAAILGPLAMAKLSMTVLGINLTSGVGILGKLGGAISMVGRVFAFVGRLFLMNPIGLAITAIALGAYLLWSNWSTIGPKFAAMWDGIKAGASRMWDSIKGASSAAFNAVSSVASSLWASIKQAFAGGILGVGQLIINWSPLGLFYQAFAGVMSWFGVSLPAKFTQFGANILQGLVSGILSGMGAVKNAITSAGEKTIGWFKEKLGIHSPSRVFAQLGGFTMAGLTQGLADNQGGPLAAVLDVAKKVTAAGAGIAVSAGAAAGGIALDTRPPLSASPPAATAPASSQPIQIIINAAPGMDEARLAKLVAIEVEKLQRQQAARKRSSLRDSD